MRPTFTRDGSAWPPATLFLLISVVTALIAGALILWPDPVAPLLLIGAALGAAGSLVLLQYPLAACYLAAFLSLWPFGARPAALDILYTIAVNGTLALALAALLLQVARRQQRLLLNPTCIAMGLFIGWAAMTVLWAPDLVKARQTLVGYSSGLILIFVLTNQTRTPRTIDSLMTVLRVLGWVMIGVGVYTLLEKGYQSGTRLQILNENENEFGVVVILTVPGVLWPVMRGRGLRRRTDMVLSLVFLSAALALIALTGSRGSSVSLLVVMLTFLFSKPLRPWGVSSLIICLVALASAPFILSEVITRFAENDGGEFGGRDVLWRAGLMLLGNAPWTGVGIGSGPAKLHNYIASLTNYFNRRVDLPAHNPLLEVGIDAGVIGLCLYAAAIVAAFRQFLGRAARAKLHARGLTGYFPLILGIAAGYFISWIKGGGLENHPSFFAMLALLQIPSQLAPVAQPGVPGGRGTPVDPGELMPERTFHA